MTIRRKTPTAAARFMAACLGASALTPALALAASPAAAQPRDFQIDAQPLQSALLEFSRQSQSPVVASTTLLTGLSAPEVRGQMDEAQALDTMLADSDLYATRSPDGGWAISRKVVQAPQGGSAAGAGAEVEALIVTAQKREENIQDVPIAISAFSAKDLEQQKIEGGFDLLKAIPNVTFSKNNFTSYNFSIRGVGTKAISATTDPGVAVSFNNTALLQNRLFEQEYFDVERVEVLRGPQGTLYGRNATAGVINVITAKPDMNDFDGWVKGEVGNYHSKRASAMINVPIVDDVLAVRFAGSLTDRQGYDFNEGTGNAVNGRDLWSARVTVGFNPTEHLRTDLVWERFNEDDNRSRTSKQLCKRDPGPHSVGGFDLSLPDETITTGGLTMTRNYGERRYAVFSQGCGPVNLYDDAAFGTPNGLAMPFILAALIPTTWGAYGPGFATALIDGFTDPYGEMDQSRDLRVINSIKDPRYVAKADVVQLNIAFDISDSLSLFSQTVYNKDSTYSSQDFNRFNTVPVFNDTSNWTNAYKALAPGGIFCDPQLGCSDKLVGYDIAQAKGTQFGQELRLQSDFEGPMNFSLGANYTKFQTLVDYYVFNNFLTALAIQPVMNFAIEYLGQDPRYVEGACEGFNFYVTDDDPATFCPYVDPNPLESINGEGHNYFRSKNPYKLTSAAAFGEVYWNIRDDLKLTAGLRYTDDRKTFIPVPSQVLLAFGGVGGGTVERGYPELPPIKQHWGEFTGRLGLDWKPELSFTDDSMLYAFYSRGYKGGGANPPTPGFGDLTAGHFWGPDAEGLIRFWMRDKPEYIDPFLERFLNTPMLRLTGVEYERTFEPEFVNAFEVGSKNTLLGGALMANLSAFFYDYKDYQVSQIRDRTAVNENFDAGIWGVEVETLFAPSRNLRINASLGYLDTAIGDGETSIDIMDRTAGNDYFVVAKPWVQLPSNCVVPVHVARYWAEHNGASNLYQELCGGSASLYDLVNVPLSTAAGQGVIDTLTGLPYTPLYYNGENGTFDIHGGAGIAKDLSGNELPNSPHWTVTLGVQYKWELGEAWTVTLRGDGYWQSQSYHRVYNFEPYDKLHGWYNANLSLWIERPDDDLKIELYAKNLLDKTPITDAFLNSDDTALTTNVFVLDPRLIGLSIRKGF